MQQIKCGRPLREDGCEDQVSSATSKCRRNCHRPKMSENDHKLIAMALDYLRFVTLLCFPLQNQAFWLQAFAAMQEGGGGAETWIKATRM